MDSFIRMVVERLGFPEESARLVTADLLLMIMDHLEVLETEELLQEFPEIRGLLEQARGSGISGMLRRVRTMLGMEEELYAVMYRVGRGAESLRPFIHLFVSFLKANTSNNLAARILGQYPALDESLG